MDQSVGCGQNFSVEMASRKRKGSEAQKEEKKPLRCGFCKNEITDTQAANWDPETATPYCIKACLERNSVACDYCSLALDPEDGDVVWEEPDDKDAPKCYCDTTCQDLANRIFCAECKKELRDMELFNARIKGNPLCEGECTKAFVDRLEERAREPKKKKNMCKMPRSP